MSCKQPIGTRSTATRAWPQGDGQEAVVLQDARPDARQGAHQHALAGPTHVGDPQGLRSGGENGLHTHPNEDHTFIRAAGQRALLRTPTEATRTSAARGHHAARRRVLLVRATSKEPLVLVRVGCRVAQDASGGLNIRGERCRANRGKQARSRGPNGEFFE